MSAGHALDGAGAGAGGGGALGGGAETDVALRAVSTTGASARDAAALSGSEGRCRAASTMLPSAIPATTAEAMLSVRASTRGFYREEGLGVTKTASALTPRAIGERERRMSGISSLAPVVLVLGKGGVGKTTIAASLAALAAETHGLATLVEFGDGASGKRALHGAHKGVEHVVVKPSEAIKKAAAPLFGSATIAKLVLDNFAMRPLIRAAPAIRELAMLEIVRLACVERPGVRVVVDMPATGHGVAWLRVPRQGRDFLASGPLFAMCDRLATTLLAPGCASIVVVTLPEKLVVEETLELCAALANDVGLPADRIVVNRMPAALPERALDDARAIASRPGALADPAAALASVLDARLAATTEALASIEALSARDHKLWRVPLAPVDPSARDVARWLRAEGAA